MSSISPSSHRRKRIAVLIDHMDDFFDGYETSLRGTFDLVCKEHDVDLLFVYGRALAGPPEWCTGYNSIFNLLRPESVDGIVLIAASLATYTGFEGLTRFCEQYARIPMVSVGVPLPNMPCVLLDDAAGMRSIVEHLVQDHGCRRLAFVSGSPENPDSIIRQEACREVLARHGLTLSPDLVVDGEFTATQGHRVMQRLLRSDALPDAVVCANDGMASGVLNAIRQHGLRVPLDMLVTGFDDLTIASTCSPPLTTVAQPFFAIADTAIRLALGQTSELSTATCHWLPTQLVIRQSCGCMGQKPFSNHNANQVNRIDLGKLLCERWPQIDQALVRSSSSRFRPLHATMRSALQSELEGHTRSLRDALDGALQTSDQIEGYGEQLLLFIDSVRAVFQDVATIELELLWQDARSFVTAAVSRSQAHRHLVKAEAHIRTATASELCLRALDLPSLGDAIAASLRDMGVDTSFVARYCDEGSSELEPIVCWVNGQREHGQRSSYRATQLFPPDVPLPQQRQTWLVFPLAFEVLPLGLAIFASSSVVSGWQVYRNHIATAIRTISLMQEIVHTTTENERSVQERLNTAKRMEALSLLAGGVAHDLNNALGPLVALPEVALRELANASARHQMAPAELRNDLETMQIAATRAAETIKDLLTMSRQGRAAKALLDLNSVVATCTEDATRSVQRDSARKNTTTVWLHPEPLIVLASHAHLVRAVGNLIRNANEAIETVGSVSATTERIVLAEPLEGHETIAPGDYAVVRISDTGKGIAASDLGRIFEPFFTKKKTGNESGSGLGLAIVHGVVKEHQGFADVQSLAGRGTTFTLYLPRSTKALERKAQSSDTPCGRAKILFIDDEPIQLRTAKRVLTHLGYDVDTTTSGRIAIDGFLARAQDALGAKSLDSEATNPYDLVIVDMQLNEAMDGLEVTEEIQKLDGRTGFVITSGHAPTSRAERALEKGIIWLSKPYTIDSLGRAVRDALQHSLNTENGSGSK